MKDKQDFKIILLFPPTWLPETPYLSLPALSAYLKQNGYQNVFNRDLNIEFWKHFHRENQLKTIYQWSKELFNYAKKGDKSYSSEGEIAFLTEIRMMFLEDKILKTSRILNFKSQPFPSENEFIEKIKSQKVTRPEFRNLCQKFWSSTAIRESTKNIPEFQWQSPLKYHDFFFTDISYSQLALSANSILQIINNPGQNAFDSYFQEHTISSIVQLEPDVIGISVVAVNQVIPAFTLAKLLKEKLPSIHIVLGGAWCTHLHNVLPQKYPLFKWIDSIVFYEGEHSLLKLVENLRLHKDLKTVPNLIYKDEGKVHVNSFDYQQDLNLLPTPDFDDFPLNDYDFVGTIPLQGSRGCSWHLCAFCSYPVIDPTYRRRDPELILKDINTLIKKFAAREFSFTDSVFEPQHINRISASLLKHNIKTKWRGFARFDAKLTPHILKQMSAAGCQILIWGLESGCKRILKLIRKGSSPALISRILKDSANAGIHNRACIIYGFPTETLDEVQTTIQFIKNNATYIHSLAYSFLTLERNTPMVENPENFFLDIEKNLCYDLNVGYGHKTNLGESELLWLDEKLRELAVVMERMHGKWN